MLVYWRTPHLFHLEYPPNVNWRPDLSLLHAARDGNHVAVDVTCPSVATQTAVPATSHMPLAAAIAAAALLTAQKHPICKYCGVLPRTMPPFVVGHGGGINKEGMGLFSIFVDVGRRRRQGAK